MTERVGIVRGLLPLEAARAFSRALVRGPFGVEAGESILVLPPTWVVWARLLSWVQVVVLE